LIDITKSGSRRECLDHVILFSETHLRRILSCYFRYYHRTTTHLSLSKDCPDPRRIQPPSAGKKGIDGFKGGRSAKNYISISKTSRDRDARSARPGRRAAAHALFSKHR